jgi:hypothetical protein
LKDATGTIVQSVTLPRWVAPVQVGSSTAQVNETVSNAEQTPGTTFTQTGSSYLYNWNTKRLPEKSVWRIGVSFDDGQTYTADISLR